VVPFQNCVDFDRLCILEKRGDEILKKSPPLKLLAEMILGWSSSKTFEEISIFSNGGHLGWRAGLSDTILKGTHPGTIPARFGLIWFSGFRGEDIVIFSSETTGPIATKLWWKGPWMAPFQNCVR
jgi:hypothetical protein